MTTGSLVAYMQVSLADKKLTIMLHHEDQNNNALLHLVFFTFYFIKLDQSLFRF